MNENSNIDLSDLQNFNFSTDWGQRRVSTGGRSQPHNKSFRKGDQFERRTYENRSERKFDNKTERGGGRPNDNRPDRKFDNNRPSYRSNRNTQFRDFRKPWDSLAKEVLVSFLPEQKPWDTLVRGIRSSYKTYELFNISKLILEKPDRFAVKVETKPESEYSFWISAVNGVIFDSEEEAEAYIFKNNFDDYFSKEEKTIEPPKGNFTVVNKCGITGALLGPPNYHKYQQILREHFSTNISSVDYDQFVSEIESIKDSEVINQWVASMTKEFVYTLKNQSDSKITEFHTTESAKRHFLTVYKHMLLKQAKTTQFSGVLIETMERSLIKGLILDVLSQQKKFPLDTTNNLRTFLRRSGISIYKKGNKGISFACAIKRKFRDDHTIFSDSIKQIIEFIEKHPLIKLADLQKSYFTSKKQNDSDTQSPETSPETSSEAEQISEVEKIPESADLESQKQFLNDVKWLIQSGYVVQYENESLFANPILIVNSPQKSDKKEENTDSNETNSVNKNSTDEQNLLEENTPLENEILLTAASGCGLTQAKQFDDDHFTGEIVKNSSEKESLENSPEN